MMKGYVLLTAMPPTVGHDALVEFAGGLGLDSTVVIVMTQPGEPYPYERANHFKTKFPVQNGYIHYHMHETIEQDPAAPGFRQMWVNLMVRRFDFKKGDFIITSEPYGQWMAEWLEGTWIPYDIKREIVPSKASDIRARPVWFEGYWEKISPEFRTTVLTRTITTFGAESCGKTTTAAKIAKVWNGVVKPEWARGYLEAVGPELSVERMENIHRGQGALQLLHADSPFVVQDTDLFSTLGYWRMYSPDTVPDDLVEDAITLQSHLYVVCSSDIPFVPDQLRYGGDKRESTDSYWIDLLEEFDLNYVVYTRSDPWAVGDAIQSIVPDLSYDRNGF